jgi:hypothetical protein
MRRQSGLLLASAFTVCSLTGGYLASGGPAEDKKGDKNKDKKEDKNEVHLVSIYEGFERTGEIIHGPKALVYVDRPGKNVILVLTSYSGATWHVAASKDTRLRKVILGGYEKQAVDGIPDKTEIVKAWRGQSRGPVHYSYRPVGPGFRRVLKQVHALTDTELASFHGSYRADAESAFVVDGIQDAPQLSVNYPQPTPRDELPRDARDVTFVAHHYVAGGHSSFGEFTVSGPVEKKLKPLPTGARRMTYDPDSKLHYGISGHGVVQIDAERKDVKAMELGLDVPKLSWPCDITYDSKRKRVILGGGGYLYAYSTENKEWSVISKRPGALDAFVYSPEDDCIYGVLFEHSEDGNVASLAKLNAEGAVISRFTLGPPIHPGSLNTGPGVSTTQVAIAGKYIAVLASPSGRGDEDLDAASIYLVDPASEKVWLTSKKTSGK